MEGNDRRVGPTAIGLAAMLACAACGRLDYDHHTVGADLDFTHVPQDVVPAAGPDAVVSGVVTIDTTMLTVEPGGSLGAVVETSAQEPSGPELAVLRVGSLEVLVGAELRVRGTRPFVLLATGSVIVDGTIDGAAEGTEPGPGGAPPGMGAGVGSDGPGMPNYDGGGGGGAFARPGADGGQAGGMSGCNPAIPGGVGGAPYGDAVLTVLEGGSAGGAGSPGDCMVAPGGAGGGAIQISAGSVSVRGAIHVGGGGGSGPELCGGNSGAGSGGGSGGAMYLEAPRITVEGVLAANGGGGSSPAHGCRDILGTPGDDGQPMLAAAFGGMSTFATGGNGGTRDADAEPGMPADCGDYNAGGGGGGVGRIAVRSPDYLDAGAIVTPAAVLAP